MKIPMGTPWGPSQAVKQLAEGIVAVTCAGHGGIGLDAARNAEMPAYLRNEDGWYEEDVGWALPAVVFKKVFAKDQEAAAKTFADWYPGKYEKYFNRTLLPGESKEKDRREFLRKHANDYIVMTAWGDWHTGVPEGQVVVRAHLGADRRREYMYFVIPHDEYCAVKLGSFIVDANRYPRFKSFPE